MKTQRSLQHADTVVPRKPPSKLLVHSGSVELHYAAFKLYSVNTVRRSTIMLFMFNRLVKCRFLAINLKECSLFEKCFKTSKALLSYAQ